MFNLPQLSQKSAIIIHRGRALTRATPRQEPYPAPLHLAERINYRIAGEKSPSNQIDAHAPTPYPGRYIHEFGARIQPVPKARRASWHAPH